MEFKDQFTLDGRLKAHPFVTREKAEKADELLTEALRGNQIASGQLREAFTSSDLPFSLAHIVSATLIPMFDEAERTWSSIAGVRTVSDFGPVALATLFDQELKGSGIHEDGGLVRVPEAAPYPHVTLGDREAVAASIQKHGARFARTWESSFRDVEGWFADLPNQLLNAALDTEEREVYEALSAAQSNTLQSITLPGGATVPANAALSADAIRAAIYQLKTTVVRGRQVGKSSKGYNVVVPVGMADFVNYFLTQDVVAIQDGAVTLSPGLRESLADLSVVESPYLAGSEWYVLPKVGGLRVPVLELGRLRGYERPELRVANEAGFHIGGTSPVSPFQGSFENDTIDLRVRYVCGGILWDDNYVVYSDGSGTA